MAGRICVHKEKHFLRNWHHSPVGVHEPERAIDEEREHWHKRALLGEFVGEHRVKEYGGLPVFGMVAHQFLGM